MSKEQPVSEENNIQSIFKVPEELENTLSILENSNPALAEKYQNIVTLTGDIKDNFFVQNKGFKELEKLVNIASKNISLIDPNEGLKTKAKKLLSKFIHPKFFSVLGISNVSYEISTIQAKYNAIEQILTQNLGTYKELLETIAQINEAVGEEIKTLNTKESLSPAEEKYLAELKSQQQYLPHVQEIIFNELRSRAILFQSYQTKAPFIKTMLAIGEITAKGAAEVKAVIDTNNAVEQLAKSMVLKAAEQGTENLTRAIDYSNSTTTDDTFLNKLKQQNQKNKTQLQTAETKKLNSSE